MSTSLTAFPFGLSSFGMPLIGSGPYISTGKVFFVHYGTGANGTGRGASAATPFKTLMYAISQARANKGDTIFLMPGHAEDIIAAGTVDVTKAGLTIIGLGYGGDRPTFTFKTSTAATFNITAASCMIQNVVFDYTGLDAIATGVGVYAADVWFYDCRFVMANGSAQAVLALVLGTGSTRTRVVRCTFMAPNAGATAAIRGVTAHDSLLVQDSFFTGDFATAAISNATVAWTNIRVLNSNFLVLGTGKAIVVDASATGVIRDNGTQITANIAAGGSMTAAACLKVNNQAQETAGVASSAVVDPAAVAIT
jgi:hypothetical protein